MTYDALDIANYIVEYQLEKNKPVTNLKLQKLLYYVQAASLVENNKPMFKEKINAWQYGPVVEDVYSIFRSYINKPITSLASSLLDFADILFPDKSEEEIRQRLIEELNGKIELEDRNLIEEVLNSYFKYTGATLINKTHNEEPWKYARPTSSQIIKTEAIKSFYKKHRDLLYG